MTTAQDYITAVLNAMPRYSRDIALGAMGQILPQKDSYKDCEDVRLNICVSIWRVVVPAAASLGGDVGRGQAIRELMGMFVKGEMHAWICGSVGHFGPLASDHKACSATLTDLVSIGVYTTDGQQRTDEGWNYSMQRAYLSGTFVMHPKVSFEQVLYMFRCIEGCNFIVHNDATFFALVGMDMLGTQDVDECYQFVINRNDDVLTIDCGKPHTTVYLDVNAFEFECKERVVDFTIWDDAFLHASEFKDEVPLDARLLKAIQNAHVVCDVAKATYS